MEEVTAELSTRLQGVESSLNSVKHSVGAESTEVGAAPLHLAQRYGELQVVLQQQSTIHTQLLEVQRKVREVAHLLGPSFLATHASGSGVETEYSGPYDVQLQSLNGVAKTFAPDVVRLRQQLDYIRLHAEIGTDASILEILQWAPDGEEGDPMARCLKAHRLAQDNGKRVEALRVRMEKLQRRYTSITEYCNRQLCAWDLLLTSLEVEVAESLSHVV